MGSDAHPEVRELSDIHQNWFDGEAPCEACPRRDCDHVTGPLYGRGDVPADIAIVAQAPGGGSVKDTTGEKIGDGKRTWKNYRDSSHDGATVMTRDSFQMEPIYTLGNYESDIKPVMKALEQACQKQLSRSCSTYYTQHTKCNDIREMDSFDPTDDKGQDLCSSYLIPELKLVQPEVVLVMGGKPDNHLQRAMEDLGVSSSKIPNRVKDTVFEDPEESTEVRTYETDLLDTTTVLPSYHYGAQALRSMKDYTVIDSDEEYWRLLTEKAASYFS